LSQANIKRILDLKTQGKKKYQLPVAYRLS